MLVKNIQLLAGLHHVSNSIEELLITSFHSPSAKVEVDLRIDEPCVALLHVSHHYCHVASRKLAHFLITASHQIHVNIPGIAGHFICSYLYLSMISSRLCHTVVPSHCSSCVHSFQPLSITEQAGCLGNPIINWITSLTA